MKQVLIIARLAPPYYSGSGQSLLLTARALSSAGVPCTLLSTRRRGDAVPAREDIDGVRIRRYTVRWRRHPAPLFHLQCAWWLLWHGRGVSVIQFANMPLRWRPLRWIAALYRIPVSLRMTAVGLDDLASLQAKLGAARLRSFATVRGYLLISEEFARLSRPYVRPTTQMRVLPKLMDCERYSPLPETERRQLRAELGLDNHQPVLLFTGVLNARKRPDLLIRALPAVRRAHPNVRLLLVGPGAKWDGATGDHNRDYPQRLRALAQELALGSACEFVGEVRDVERYYRAADLMVLPSRQEGVPSALLEAMACALPVLLTAASWISGELVRDGQTALLAPEDADAEVLAQAIITALDNPEQTRAIGAAARTLVVEKHSAGAVIPQLQDYFARLRRPQA